MRSAITKTLIHNAESCFESAIYAYATADTLAALRPPGITNCPKFRAGLSSNVFRLC